MRLLITGGAGFIGSHLGDALVRQGHEVTAFDDLSTGSVSNIRHLAGDPRFTFVRGSVLDEAALAPLVASADVVFHLAAAVGVRLVLERPLHTLLTNVTGTELVLRHADAAGALTVVASTSEVYGKSIAVPFREDADLTIGAPTTWRWGYAASKLADECLALAYFEERQSRVVVVRLFNTVGPRQSARYGMVLPTFVQCALDGAPLTIHGDGSQRRCFTWIGDVVQALIGVAGQSRALGRIVNIGSPEEVTIATLAARVREAARSRSPLVYVPYGEAFGRGFEDMHRRVPDVSTLHELLGFAPRTCLDEIIARTIEYWRNEAAVTRPRPFLDEQPVA